MLYQQSSFIVAVANKPITKELWEYRVGIINADQYKQITGEIPDKE